MITYQQDNLSSFHSELTHKDFENLGIVNISRLNGSIPVYNPIYYGDRLKKYDKDTCDGSCMDFIM